MAEELNQKNNEEAAPLEELRISDDDLEQVDSLSKEEKKAAKKRAKQLRTPEEKKRHKRKVILLVSGGVLMVVGALFALPLTRWFILNSLGFRGSLSVLVQEKTSNVTVTDVDVLIDEVVVGSTDVAGQLHVSQVKLGDRTIRLEKPGYSRQQLNQTVGLGLTKMNATVEAIGVKVVINAKNWLTNKPIPGAKLTSGEATATADKKGLATLIIPPSDEKTDIKIEAPGYHARNIELDPGVFSKEVTLVASAKNYFISKRDGNFDIFSSNLDGTNQKKIIEATGKENADFLQFSVHRSNKQAVLVATRDGARQNDRIIAGVYKVDLEKASLTKIDEGSDVRLLDWAGDTMLYTKTIPTVKYDDKNFARIQSYNVLTSTLAEQARANYFQLALAAGDSLLFMAADAYRPIANADLTSVSLTNNARKTYLKDKQVSYGVQTNYGIVQLETVDGQYHQIDVSSGVATRIDRQPGSVKQFGLSQNATQVAFADKRDGKGALIVRNTKDGTEKIVTKEGGLVYPIRWVSSELIVARVATNQETADYVVDVTTGKMAKIVDVSNVGYGQL